MGCISIIEGYVGIYEDRYGLGFPKVRGVRSCKRRIVSWVYIGPLFMETLGDYPHPVNPLDVKM